MATPITTVAAVKFADTLDITALSADQIAKFTDKDFAAFTTQQQSDLTNAQVKLLTAKQVAALPLKFVEPDTISGVDPKAISGMRLSNLSVEQFSALTSAQIQNIPATDFANLSAAQAAVLDELQVLGLSAAQVATIPSKSVASLMASTIEALPKAAVTGFTPENVIGLTTDTIQALTTEQANALSSKQINALKSNVLAQMEAEDLAALNLDALRGLNKKNITGVTLQALTPEQFGVLTPTQIKLLTPTQLSNLTEEFAPLFTSKVLMAMSAKQVEAVATSIVNTLDPLALKGFNTKNIKGLSSDQIATLTEEHAAVLTKSQVGALSASQVGALPSATVIALTPMAFKGFSNSILATLSTEVISGLGEAVISVLTPAQLAAFTTTQVSALSGSQIQLLKPGVFNSFTDTGMANLGSEAISNLTTAQVAKLTTAQLGKFTPAQVTNLSSEVKDWVVAKKFALLQSADTVAGGIQTTGTIAGTTLSETITSGAGNDTISTGGVKADSIDAGAGNDTITLTSSTTVATHTIKGGAGTDTLIFGGVASALTSVTEIENLKLSTANSNQTLALGSGAGNSFASVDASILASGKTLTLTGSVTNLNVAVGLGNLSAGTYAGGLNVTALGGDSSIVTYTGADSIDAGAGNDTINAGQGADTIKGGTGADNFVFAAGDSGIPSSSFDTITDFSETDGDIIDFGSTTISIEQTSGNPSSAAARISATGLASFDDADNTLAKKIIATEAAIASGTLTAGEAALFTEGLDSYVFISDAVSGIGSNDVLIKLTGGGSGGALGIANGDITSVAGYNVSSFTGSGSLTEANAVYIVDTGANVAAALVESSNSSSLLGANNASPAYPKAALIDVIDASDTDTISMTVGQEQALTAAKLAADDTIHIVDTNTNIAAKITELVADVAKIDLLDVSGNAITITYAQAAALNTANLTFASNDVITITVDDADVAAASALSITDLGGASITLDGDNTVALTQAQATAQHASTKWKTDDVLTVTATDAAGEHTISTYRTSVLGGASITLKGSDNAVELTYTEATAQHASTKWSTADALTVTGIDSNTKAGVAAAFNKTVLGGSGITLDATGATVSIAHSVAKDQPTGTLWESTVAVTITGTISAGAEATAAETKYTTTGIGGQTVTIESGISMTKSALDVALAAGQQFTGALTVTGILDAEEAAALTAYTHATTGASTIYLDTADNAWSIAGATLTTALTTGQIKFGSDDVLTVTGIDTSNQTNSEAALVAFTKSTTSATSLVLDSTGNAWSVDYTKLPTVANEVTFGSNDVVTVMGVNVANKADAAALDKTVLGGSSIILDTANTAVSLTDAQAAAQPTGTQWESGAALTITDIGATTTEANALTEYTKTLIGGSGVTLVATDNNWSVAAADLTNALDAAASIKLAGDLTVTGIANADETASLTAFTSTLTGATNVVLTAADNTWSITATDLKTALDAGIKFAGSTTDFQVTGIASGLNGTGTDALAEAYAITAFTQANTGVGASGFVTLNATDTNWSVTKTNLAAALTNKINLAGAVTVTGITSAEATTNSAATIGALELTDVGATSIVLDATNNAWTVAQGSLPAAGVEFGSDDVVTVTVATESTASALSTNVLGGASITLDGDTSVSLTRAEAAAQALNNTTYSGAKTLWKSDDALTVTGIATADEAAALAYTTTALGGSGVILDNVDTTWSVASGDLTTALAGGIKFVAGDALTVTVASTDNAAALSGFTPTTTGVDTTGSIVLDSVTGTNAWAIAYSELPATTNVTFGTDDVVTITVPNANEVAASALSTSVIGGASIVLNGDNAISLTATQATAQIATTNTKWHTDDVITVTGITSGNQAAALQNYRKAALGGTSLVLETSEATGWTVTEEALQSALAAAGNTTPATVNSGNKLALTTVGALTDKVTITDIIIANETNALTVYDKSLLGVESVVLDAADNSWSIAESTATPSTPLATALAAGIKFASGDTLTVTAATNAGLTAFTSAKTGAGNVVLDGTGANAWSIAGTDLTTALAAGIKLDSSDTLTVTAISNETSAITAFTKTLTGASSVVLDAADNTWSISKTDIDTVLSTTTPTGITFASGDKVTVTGLVTTNAVDQAAALAAYTPTKVGALTIVLDSTGDAWSMTESALAQKASGVTFANSDTLTIVDISQTQELVAVPNAAALKYTAALTGASTVVLDAADNSWSITKAAADLAIAGDVTFRSTTAGTITADTLTITGSGAEITTLITTSFADLVGLGGSTRTLDIAPNDTATFSVAVAHNAMDNSILFAAGDTVAITMSQAADTLDFTDVTGGKVATLGAATKHFVYSGATNASPSTVTAGGVTFVNVADNTQVADTDYFLTVNIDVITGFNAASDIIDLTAFGAGAAATNDITAGAATDLTTTGDLIADDKYQIVKGTYTSADGKFLVDSTGSDNLVVWDGDPTTGIDIVGVVIDNATPTATNLII